MKSKDKKTLKSKDVKELLQFITEEKKSLFALKLDLLQNKLKNTRSLFAKRKDIARAFTYLREKQLAE